MKRPVHPGEIRHTGSSLLEIPEHVWADYFKACERHSAEMEVYRHFTRWLYFGKVGFQLYRDEKEKVIFHLRLPDKSKLDAAGPVALVLARQLIDALRLDVGEKFYADACELFAAASEGES